MKRDPEELLNAATQLQPNLQFTLEKINEKGILAFPFINVNVYTGKNVICGWYQKPTD